MRIKKLKWFEAISFPKDSELLCFDDRLLAIPKNDRRKRKKI